ncbi:MAG: FAD-dependent oxidoreductase, partial [Thermodesulfobacteriota bacterium]
QFWARSYSPRDLNCDFYDYSNIYRQRATQNSLITTNCIYSERVGKITDGQAVEAALRELAENIPRASRARVIHNLVVRIPMAIHCPYPGVERRRPGVKTGVGNLFVAGDWVQTHVPASMESAACSGLMAAEAILTAAGKPKKLAVPPSPSEGVSAMAEKLAPRLRKMGYLPRPEDVVGK